MTTERQVGLSTGKSRLWYVSANIGGMQKGGMRGDWDGYGRLGRLEAC